MKYFFLFLLFSLFNMQSLYPQVFWEPIGPYTGDITDIVMDNDNYIFVATKHGGVFRTTNYGNTWIEVSNGLTNKIVLSLAIKNNVIFASNQHGLFMTTDKGDTWNKPNPDFFIDFHDIYVNKDQTLMAGNSGEFYISTNNGYSWELTLSHYNLFFTSINKYTEEIFAVNKSVACKSNDFGVTWDTLNTFPDLPSLNSLVTNSLDYFFMGTYSQGILRSTDFGFTWQPMNNGLNDTTAFAVFVDKNDFIYAATNTATYKSSNYGESWERFDDEMNDFSIRTVATDTGEVIIAGTKRDGILFTTDDGTTWERRNIGLNNSTITSMIESSESEIFVATLSNGIYRTINNREEWLSIDKGISGINFYSLAINSDDHIFAGSDRKGIFKSTDMGSSWTKILSPASETGIFGDIYINSKNNVFAKESNFISILYRSIDNGTTWDSIYSGINLLFLDKKDNIFIHTTLNPIHRLMRSTDNGNNWEIVLDSISYLSYLVQDFDGNIYANLSGGVFSDERILKSTDYGLTWLQVSSHCVNRLSVTPYGFFIEIDQGINLSTDNGNTWSQINEGLTNRRIWDIFYDSDAFTYVGTQGNGLFKSNTSVLPVELYSFSAICTDKNVEIKWTTSTEINNSGFEVQRKKENMEWEIIHFIPGNGTTSEEKFYSFTDRNLTHGKYSYRLKQIDFDGSFEYSDEVQVKVVLNPEEYVLEQNYPNPFNPTTKIKYSIKENMFVTLNIYDVLGNKIFTLVNEEQSPGYYEVEFNNFSLSTGVYYYQLKAGNFISTKKMILIK